MVIVGSVLAGYLVKRRGGNSTVTGQRAALIGGFPVLWTLPELLSTVVNLPNPPWFQAVSIVLALGFGVLAVALVAVLGALAGRFGGWLAERRGHSGVANAGGSS
jgi:MFS family permease